MKNFLIIAACIVIAVFGITYLNDHSAVNLDNDAVNSSYITSTGGYVVLWLATLVAVAFCYQGSNRLQFKNGNGVTQTDRVVVACIGGAILLFSIVYTIASIAH